MNINPNDIGKIDAPHIPWNGLSICKICGVPGLKVHCIWCKYSEDNK